MIWCHDHHWQSFLGSYQSSDKIIEVQLKLPATEEDVFGLFDDLLQQPLTLLQAGDFSFVVGQWPR